jgi:hypothetical protein
MYRRCDIAARACMQPLKSFRPPAVSLCLQLHCERKAAIARHGMTHGSVAGLEHCGEIF